MKHILTTALSAFALLFAIFAALGAPAQAQEPPPPDIVPINGTAYWGTEPTGPDFEGVTRIPFQAQNPTRDVWAATQAQNQRYLDPHHSIPPNIQVSYSGIITGASNFVNDFSEVMVAIDPTDPNHLLGASKFFYQPATYSFYTGVFESYDGGYNWTELQPPGVENYSLTSDPVTTFDDAGNGYFTLLTRGPTGLDMLKKSAGGDWELPVVVDRTTYTDKQWIIGDQNPQGTSPYAGHLYMSWTDVGTSRIVVARSTDGNQNWSPPLLLASNSVQGSIPGVAPDGTVYVVYGRSIFSTGSGTLEFVKSTDGGATYTSPAVAANISPIPFYLPNTLGHSPNFRSPASLPAFAVSPVDGNLYIAWADYRNGDSDIYFARSTDGGANWSAPVRLNDDPLSNGIDQWQTQISVAPNGRVAVMWFDRRLDCPDEPWIPPTHVGVSNACIDTFMTRSFDEGLTWVPNIRASAQTWDWTLNLPTTGGGDGFIGDYQGIASSNDFDYPFWNATANLGDNANNYQQIFIAIVPVASDLSTSSKQVAPGMVAPGGTLTYTITLDNSGGTDAAHVVVTDTLPFSTTYVSSSLSYPHGAGDYNPATHEITWTGWVSTSTPVDLTYQLTTDFGLADGTTLTNTAVISDAHEVHQREAVATLNTPPAILATSPANGATAVPVTTSLAITFSEGMQPASLSLSIAPNPGNLTPTWSAGNAVLTVELPALAYSQTYTVTLGADDDEGQGLVPGAAPNPWAFTTKSEPIGPAPYILQTLPANTAISVPITASLTITFSEPILTGTLAFTVTGSPGGWLTEWNADATAVSLTPTSAWAYSQTYTVTAAATDTDGLPLASGPAPNPWSFTTVPEPFTPPAFDIFLPLIKR